jgi:uncharacterized RDD family membrane protein YckC
MSSSGVSPFTDGTTTYEALQGCTPATLGRRFAARVLDLVLGGAVGVLISLAVPLQKSLDGLLIASVMVQVLAIALSFGVYLYFGKTGFLPGGRILGIRQVRVADGRAPGWAGLGKYLLISLVSGFTFGIGYLITVLMIKKPLNRAWHDTATGLVVLDVKAGRDPLANRLNVVPARLSPGSPAATGVVDPSAAQPTSSSSRPAVVSVGSIAAPVLHASNDATSLALPFPEQGLSTAQPMTSAAAVVSVGDGGMITGVPWSRGSASAPSSPDVDQSFMPLPANPSPVPAAQPPVEDESDRTVVSLDAIALLQAQHTMLLVSDDGQRIPVDKATVLGRNPVAPEGFAGSRLHPLQDTTMSVSKTHAVVGPDADGVWVQDLRSTNGTAVTTANGMRTAVPSGGRLIAGHGAVVHIGKVAFRVTEQ